MMPSRRTVTAPLLLALLHEPAPALGCTTLIAGAKATRDGSVFASHTNDGGATTDPRLVAVPAADHAAGATRPVFFSPESYPRYSGKARGIPAYYPDGALNQTEMRPLGSIPQAAHTYAYFEQTYGALNENQVGIGESTCSAISWSKHGGAVTNRCAENDPAPAGCSLFSVDQLSQVCMERSKTARQCVETMGALAEKRGFYGADGFEGSGESLMVIDKHEGWIFHVLSDPTGASAIWGAQRVADNHVGVVANAFTIRAMNLSDTAQFLGSAGMPAAAKLAGLGHVCPSASSCDFTRAFSDGEYAHKFYSGRRMWGAYRLLAPAFASANLSPAYGDLKEDAPYPATAPVAPEALLSLEDMFSVHRHYYQGTPYDLSKGMAAGPYGTPNRFGGGAGEQAVPGNWERPISLFRTSDSHVVQARAHLPDAVGGTLWFAPHCPQTSVFMPVPAGALGVSAAYSRGHQGALDKSTAFWAHRAVAQLVDNKFKLAHVDVVQTYAALEKASRQLQAEWDRKWDEALPEYGLLTQDFVANADGVLSSWWSLFDALLFKYADGWDNSPALGGAIGYPAWWLRSKEVNFTGGPPPIGATYYPRPPPRLAQASGL